MSTTSLNTGRFCFVLFIRLKTFNFFIWVFKVKPALPKVPYAINCSLCGCNGASVRCIKCNSMAFCIGCDDMYHRHPKRRSHLRQAVALEFVNFLSLNIYD